MTSESPTDWLIVSSLEPITDGELAPLYEATSEGILKLPFCRACGQVLELEQLVCDRCHTSDRAWREVELRGVVHAVTMVFRHEAGLTVYEGPYHVVDVEMTSGHRIVMTTIGPMAVAPSVGDVVVVGFRRVGNVTVPAVERWAGEGMIET